MRILLIVFNETNRGTYRRAYQFGKQLVIAGDEVVLIATSTNRRARIQSSIQDGMQVVEMPDLLPGSLRSGWDPWNSLVRLGWVAKRSFDVVHAFEARPTVLFPSLYLRQLRGVPLVMDWADWFGKGGSVEERPNPLVRAILRPVETFFEERFRTNADATTVICSPLRERAIRLGVPAETILHVPNGCDIQNIFPVPIIEARRRLGLPIDGIIVGYMGASFKADVGLMNAAFSALKKQFPEISFLWVGARPEAAAKVLDGKDGIIVVPSFKERHLNDYLASFDICWLPLQNSLANAGRWPLKLNDYLAAGKPIVATRVGDMETLVEQNEVGLAAEVTPESLAACTARLVMDSDLRAAMGQRSRALAEQRFRWEDLTREVRNYYMLAVARRNADR